MSSPSLCLNSAEQALLGEALRVFTSPLDYGSTEAWARAIIEATRSMLDGVDEDPCWLQIPQKSGILDVGLKDHPIYAEGLIKTYREFEWVHRDTGAFERGARLGVVTLHEVYGPHYETVRQSVYMQEFLPSISVFDLLAINVPLCSHPHEQKDVVQLILNARDPNRMFTEHQVQKARLLHPALCAGVATHRQLAGIRERLGALLDAAGGACAVTDLGGRLLHVTPALDEALKSEPRRDDLMTSLRRLAANIGSKRTKSGGGGPPLPLRFPGIRGPYTLTPSFVRGLTQEPCLLVAVTSPPPAPALPDPDVLREHSELTPQQARVALLLAERRTNREIADALSISEHTARHHVRQTLEKLGVPRRRVRTALSRAARSASVGPRK